MSFSKLGLVKLVASGIVGVGTGKIIGSVIKTHTSPQNIVDKVTIGAAAWVIAGIVTSATKKYTNETIDEVVNNTTKLIDDFKTDAKLGRINRKESTFEKEGLDEADFVKNLDNEWTRKTKEDEAETASTEV